MITFFNSTDSMRGIQGDTFPVFTIVTDLDDLDGYTMRVDLELAEAPGRTVFTKNCTTYAEGNVNGFRVQFATTDTENLNGIYTMHFVLSSSAGDKRKLVGMLEVLPSPKGVA